MCKHAEFNTGKVSLTTADRKEITKTIGLANNSISNYLKKLKDLKSWKIFQQHYKLQLKKLSIPFRKYPIPLPILILWQ